MTDHEVSVELCKEKKQQLEAENHLLYFLHTDIIARMLRERVWITCPCQPCDPCKQQCKLSVAQEIQDLVGKDSASIVGEYLEGRSWPGKPHEVGRVVRHLPPLFSMGECQIVRHPVTGLLFWNIRSLCVSIHYFGDVV